MKFRIGIALLISALLVIAAKLLNHGALLYDHIQDEHGPRGGVNKTSVPNGTSPTSQPIGLDSTTYTSYVDLNFIHKTHPYKNLGNHTRTIPSTFFENSTIKNDLVPSLQDACTPYRTRLLKFNRQNLLSMEPKIKDRGTCTFVNDKHARNTILLNIINQHCQKISKMFDEHCKRLSDMENNGHQLIVDNVHIIYASIKQMRKILQPIIQELKECVDPNSDHYYKTCHTLPSKKIYRLFSEKNIDLFRDVRIASREKPLEDELSKDLENLVLDMMRMSNLCNESYLKNNNDKLYACSVMIRIGRNLRRTLNNGYKRGLTNLLVLEPDKKKWNGTSYHFK